jgi:hypothetical protein
MGAKMLDCIIRNLGGEVPATVPPSNEVIGPNPPFTP